MDTITTFFTPTFISLSMIFLAEMGDKSQLVCMSLASRYRAKPVLFGAIFAFAILNLLAVTVGVTLTQIIPEKWLVLAAASLFCLFGIQAIFTNEDEDDEDIEKNQSKRSIFITTFMLIFIAELGDKTQLSVATLSTTNSPIAVWVGSTIALILTSSLGVFAGRKFFSKLNETLIHRISGIFFLLLAGLLFLRFFGVISG